MIHAAAGGEPLTAVVLSSAVFGETGGDMGASTVLGQHNNTTAGGRDRERRTRSVSSRSEHGD